MKRLFVAN